MKSYEEMAKSVFEKRDEYIKAQKKSRKLNIAIALAASTLVVGIAVLGVTVNLLLRGTPAPYFSENGFGKIFGGTNASQNEGAVPTDSSSDTESSKPAASEEKASSDTASEATSSVGSTENTLFKIDSFDKLNFYTGLLAIKKGEAGGVAGSSYKSAFFPCNAAAEAPLDSSWKKYIPLPDFSLERFTVTRSLYFRISITDPDNFIAERIGTGEIEAVFTDNNFDYATTFKNGDKFYTLTGQYAPREETLYFYSRNYIEGDFAVENWHVYPHNLVIKIKNNLVKEIKMDYTSEDDYTSIDIVSGSQRGAEVTISVTCAELEKAMPIVLK